MEESLSLSQNQRLQQTLAPLQVQYVRVLEMNAPEIEDELKRTLDENPALEAVPADDSAGDLSSGADDDFNESAEQMQLADYRHEDDIPYYRLEARNYSSDDSYYEPVAVAKSESLIESLMSQLSVSKLSPRQLSIADIIVGSIDSNGYLTRTLPALIDDVAIQGGIDASDQEVREVWRKVRSLDPPGVGAYDLRDCLLLQLKRMGNDRAVSDAREIVADYFDLFSRMHFDKLSSMLNIDESRIRAALNVIRSLDPKPGSAISGGLDQDDDRFSHITPDFLVDVDSEGNITLSQPDNLPGLRIESTFAADEDINVSRKMSRSELEAMAFIKRKRDEAVDFIKALQMRRETLNRVMTAIIKLQRRFFLSGDELQLRPMILKDVSKLTGDDVSVISRATSGKYVSTQYGVYPLKFFFNERPKEDTDASTIEITNALRRLIDNEDKAHPLKDDALMTALEAQGYKLARRTVAKYREKLGIPVARLRRSV